MQGCPGPRLLHGGDTLVSLNSWFEHVLSLLPGSELLWAGGYLPPHPLCPSPFTACWALEEAVLMLVWVCLPVAGRI